MAEGRAFLEQLPVSAADKERIAHGNAWGAVTLKTFPCSRTLAFYRPFDRLVELFWDFVCVTTLNQFSGGVMELEPNKPE
jgi:hypothetical protein